jgi:single-strand DNA-binding protein
MANAKTANKNKSAKEKTPPTTPQPNPAAPSVDSTANRPNGKPVTPAAPAPAAERVADGPAAPPAEPAKPSNGVRMPRINDVRIAGRLTADPVIRAVGKQNVANFNLAVEKPYLDAQNAWQKQVSFIPCAVWGLVADRARDILHKGSPVYLEGRLRSNSWETKDGEKRSGMKLEAYKVQSLARNPNRSQGQEVGD